MRFLTTVILFVNWLPEYLILQLNRFSIILTAMKPIWAYREKNKTAAGSSSISNHTAAESKNQYLKQKQEAAQKRKTEKLRAKTASDIVACEAEIDAIDNEMAEDAASDYMRLSELHNRKQVLEERLLQLYELEETLGAEK